MRKHIVAPSLLAADWTRLSEEMTLVNESEADWFHFDVMDGVFVPNISFGLPILKAVHKLAQKPVDVHLMIENPSSYIQAFRDAGAANISVHYEACRHLHRVIHQIKDNGARAGVAINPHTPVHLLEDIIEDLDLVIVMSVNPGYGGQKFIYQTLPKVKKLKDMIRIRNTSTLIEIDGGVGLHNAEKLLQAGADILVAGSSVFKSDDPSNTIKQLKSLGGEFLKFV